MTISAEPGLRAEVLCGILGLTSKDAEAEVLAALSVFDFKGRCR